MFGAGGGQEGTSSEVKRSTSQRDSKSTSTYHGSQPTFALTSSLHGDKATSGYHSNKTTHGCHADEAIPLHHGDKATGEYHRDKTTIGVTSGLHGDKVTSNLLQHAITVAAAMSEKRGSLCSEMLAQTEAEERIKSTDSISRKTTDARTLVKKSTVQQGDAVPTRSKASLGRTTTVDSEEEFDVGSIRSRDIISVLQPLDMPSRVLGGFCCRGEPLTDTGKRLQLLKVLSLTLLPILGLWAFTVHSLNDSIQGKSDIEQTQYAVKFSVEIGIFLDRIQRERDMSVLYLSILGPETKTFLLNEYLLTDEALQQLSDWPVSNEFNSIFQSKQSFQNFLNDHRNKLDPNDFNIYATMDFYNYLIERFVQWMYGAIKESSMASIWKVLVAYQKIVTGMEHIGIERALGTVFYVEGGLSQQWSERYNNRVNIFKANYRSAVLYSKIVDSIFQYGVTSTGTNLTAVIESFRFEIQHSVRVSSSITKGQWWFDNMTMYLDRLLVIQQELATFINGELQNIIDEEENNLTISACFLVLVILMCPVVIYSVEALTSDIQKYAIAMVDKTKELFKEKRKIDTLLYQMVPAAIADRLKRNKGVDAEYFKSVTILFSDIDGFITVLKECSPLEIVSLLNNLHTALDAELDNHEVYKVETINDSYMVASGLPNRNGNRHSAAIAQLALRLIDMMTAKEFVTSQGHNIKLRIGINTGPCMAGTVGLTLPRYSLFGDTVNTASRLKSYSLPNKIHLSSSAASSLRKHGTFVVKFRGTIEVKGKGLMKTYWLLGQTDQPEAKIHRGESSGSKTAGEVHQYMPDHIWSNKFCMQEPSKGRSSTASQSAGETHTNVNSPSFELNPHASFSSIESGEQKSKGQVAEHALWSEKARVSDTSICTLPPIVEAWSDVGGTRKQQKSKSASQPHSDTARSGLRKDPGMSTIQDNSSAEGSQSGSPHPQNSPSSGPQKSDKASSQQAGEPTPSSSSSGKPKPELVRTISLNGDSLSLDGSNSKGRTLAKSASLERERRHRVLEDIQASEARKSSWPEAGLDPTLSPHSVSQSGVGLSPTPAPLEGGGGGKTNPLPHFHAHSFPGADATARREWEQQQSNWFMESAKSSPSRHDTASSAVSKYDASPAAQSAQHFEEQSGARESAAAMMNNRRDDAVRPVVEAAVDDPYVLTPSRLPFVLLPSQNTPTLSTHPIATPTPSNSPDGRRKSSSEDSEQGAKSILSAEPPGLRVSIAQTQSSEVTPRNISPSKRTEVVVLDENPMIIATLDAGSDVPSAAIPVPTGVPSVSSPLAEMVASATPSTPPVSPSAATSNEKEGGDGHDSRTSCGDVASLMAVASGSSHKTSDLTSLSVDSDVQSTGQTSDIMSAGISHDVSSPGPSSGVTAAGPSSDVTTPVPFTDVTATTSAAPYTRKIPDKTPAVSGSKKGASAKKTRSTAAVAPYCSRPVAAQPQPSRSSSNVTSGPSAQPPPAPQPVSSTSINIATTGNDGNERKSPPLSSSGPIISSM